MRIRIVEVDEREALKMLERQWQALQAQCPQATPFQTWEWNAAWWRHFGARKRPRILLFWTDAGLTDDMANGDFVSGGARRDPLRKSKSETLVGIAPFYTSFHLGTPLRRLAWIGTGQSDYLGPLALPEWEADVSRALCHYIREELRGWDMADLQQLRGDCPLLREEGKREKGNGGRQLTVYNPQSASHNRKSASPSTLNPQPSTSLPMEPCPYLTLPADWNELTARLGKKMRSNLGYYERLLGKTFAEVRWHIADADTLDAGMAALFDLHQKRWNARWLPGVLGSKRVQAFHCDVAQAFLANGWLRLHLLTIDGTIRAALYCFARGCGTYYYLGGFAPELSKYSLGTLLTGKAIRMAIEEGCAEFDFLRGNEDYKYRWLPESRINHRLLLLRSHERLGGLGELPGRAGFALNRVERYVELRAKAFAEHQGRRAVASS